MTTYNKNKRCPKCSNWFWHSRAGIDFKHMACSLWCALQLNRMIV